MIQNQVIAVNQAPFVVLMDYNTNFVTYYNNNSEFVRLSEPRIAIV